jgi:hypothetical protein
VRVEIPITVLDQATGNPVQGASVQVNLRSGPAAVVYAAATGNTQAANPLTTDAAGRVTGWLDRGQYSCVISKIGLTTHTEEFDASPGGDGGVDTAWLADGSVTGAKLSGLPPNFVDTVQLVDGAVTSGKIDDGAVGTQQVADGAITKAKRAAGIGANDAGAALPTVGLFEGYRFTVYSDDHQTAGKVANDYIYLPSIDATRPWHWCGGPGYRRNLGALNGSATGVWTNEGTVFATPYTGYYEIDLSWLEANGPGESNGDIGVGDSAGTRYRTDTVYDTAVVYGARQYRVSANYRQLINQGVSVVVWMRINDSGNPATAYDVQAHITPLRGSAA